MYVCIYIYIERERGGDTFIYTYIYIERERSFYRSIDPSLATQPPKPFGLPQKIDIGRTKYRQ